VHDVPQIDRTVDPDPISRIEAVADPGSLDLDPKLIGSSVRSARALICGTAAYVFACDPRDGGGSLGRDDTRVVVAAIERATAEAIPCVGIWHSGGARLQEGTSSLDGVGRMFRAMSLAAGRSLRISVVLGAAAGGAAYGPGLTDVIISGPAGRIFVTGPAIVRRVTGEVVDDLSLGGPDVHTRQSGLVHLLARSDVDALAQARTIVDLIACRTPRNPFDPEPDPRMRTVIPKSSRLAYDAHNVVDLLLDASAPRVELHPRWAPNILTMIGRLNGRTVGVLANNPKHLAGCLDCTASEKAAAFVEKCDRFGVPMAVLVDVPGYLPGTLQESGGIVMRGARLLQAFACATVPRVTVILRKAYGGAFIAMNCKSLGASAVYAWPSSQVGVMGAVGAVEVLHRRRIMYTAPARRQRLVDTLARQYESHAGGLGRALSQGYIDEVIDPALTRQRIDAGLQ
jgi:acetyl-CoA/propionyl-CoA carboxylase carboxyl transferase subunit